ncbi:MAG: hypothetical protein KAU21_06505, partial [Gammaproteobacteria bacterium]|nr:hypothetical protein [Gammaproteobacteria bacterium]
MENFKQQFQVLWNIHWLRRSVISAITIALILLIIPVIIQFSIPYLLKQQGADTAQIEDINLNLFAGTFELKQLIMTTRDSEPARINHIAADLQMLDLFSSQVIVNELLINGLKADVRRDNNGDISINGLLIPINKSTEAEPDPSTETVSSPLQFAVNNLSVINSNINYQEPDFSQNNTINSI